MGNVVFFQDSDLWVSDGTAAGTYPVGGLRNAGVAGTNGGLIPSSITQFQDGVLFRGLVFRNPADPGLWFSDGTAAGTYEIGGAYNSGVVGASSRGLDPGDFASGPGEIAVFGSKALFFGEDSDNFNGLWVTDGTAAGTFELGGLKNSGIAGTHFNGLSPRDLTPAEDGDKVFFLGTDTDGYFGLWVTDGTTKGTVEIGGLKNAGIAGAPEVPSDMESFGNGILFSSGLSLWFSDGTASGTVEIADTAARNLTVLGTKALFAGDDSGLWITDGTAAGTTEIANFPTTTLPGSFGGFAVVGDKAIFTEDSDGLSGLSLWVTDGTAAGTTDIGGPKGTGISGAGDLGSDPGPLDLVSIGTKVLFTAEDRSGARTLWVTDGTAAETFEIGGVNNSGVAGAPAAGLNAASIIVGSGGKGYFSSPDSTGTERLWESDGTVAGTHVVAGPTGSVSLTAATLGAVVNGGILWQNTNTGQASIWDIGGNSLVGGGAVSPNPGLNWKAIGTGDFNKDGHSDILWQNASTGQASIWEMNGNTLIGGGAVTPNPGPGWRAVGMGDFTGDGFADDILWQNTSTGQVSIWEMSGNKLMGGGPVSPNPGPAWKAIGTGDFNDDHQSDILFQNTSTGQVSIWEMDENKLMGGGPVTPNPGPSWHAIGTGDFNHDGFADDILFQNASTGQVSIWEMKDNMLMGGGPVSANPGPSWHAIGTDGGSDILFQNTSGQASIWDMSDNRIVGGGPVTPSPGPSWRAVGLT